MRIDPSDPEGVVPSGGPVRAGYPLGAIPTPLYTRGYSRSSLNGEQAIYQRLYINLQPFLQLPYTEGVKYHSLGSAKRHPGQGFDTN